VNTKEWLAAIGALSMSLNSAEAQQAGTDSRAGVTAAVNTTASGAIAGATRTLFIGNDVFRDERITTDASGRAQLLFLDQSAITVGPGAELVIDRFVYDENTKLGTLAVQARRGLLRFVGGDITKQQEAIIRSPTMEIGIRGGITLINVDPTGATQAIFVFGSQMTVTPLQGGVPQVVTRPGFGVSAGPGQPPSAPARVSGAVITGLIGQLEAPTPTGIIPSAVPAPGPGPREIAPDRTVGQLHTYTRGTELFQLGTSVNRQSTQQVQRNVVQQVQTQNRALQTPQTTRSS
jgi:hypothetical protein